MPLCAFCGAIPFRRILQGDLSLLDGTTQTAYEIATHDSIAHLFASGQLCGLCKVLSSALQTSYWYENLKTDEDESSRVWLRIPLNSKAPAIWIYLGDNRPETKVFGKDVEIYAAIDDPISETFALRYVHENPRSKLSLRQLDAWLEECNTKHETCSRVVNQEPKLPTRVLDLSTLPSREAMMKHQDWHTLFQDKTLKLAENRSNQKGRYLTLSYCWGSALAYKTTSANREDHITGIPFGILPKTLQDAILLAKYIGINYIWIDCLSIVQDDKEDWQREAAQMATIYSNSYLTIAATRASNCAEGFLGARKTNPMDPILFSDSEGDFTLYFHPVDVSPFPGGTETVSLDPLKDEVLATRAWALQERLLPIRTVHYATHQMHWECGQRSENEDGSGFGAGDEDFRLDAVIQGLQSSSLVESERRRWYQLLNAYTSRNITYLSDRLPALSGVLAAIQVATGDSCFAGIWKRHFLEGLLWRMEDPEIDTFITVAKPPKKLDTWRAPSWSFASIEGTVVYQEYYRFGTEYCAQLEECVLTAAGSDLLGELRAGYAQIKAPISSIGQVGQVKSSNGFKCFVRLRDDSQTEARVRFEFDRTEACEALMVTPHSGLAIAHVKGTKDSYVRVGSLQVWKDPDSPPLSSLVYPEPRSITLL